MRLSLKLLVMTALLSGVTATVAEAADTADLETTIKAMKARIKDQENRLSEMEEKLSETRLREAWRKEMLALLKELNVGAANPWDFRMYWKNGVRFDTNNGRLKMAFGGRLHADFGWIDGSGIESDLGTDLEDGVEVRRARLYVKGDYDGKLEFKLQFDFAEGDPDIKDAYLKFKKIPIIGNITVGHFKEPFSLEELTSSKYITFLERALPNVFAPGRNTGIMASNTFLNKRGTWAVGLFRPQVDDYGEDQVDGEAAVTARVTFLPWYEDKGRRLLHVGGGYTFRNLEDNVRVRQRPEVHWLAQRFTDTHGFFAKHAQMYNAEVALVLGPFSVQGEYIGSVFDAPALAHDPDFHGFYVQASYFLTGEHRPYKTSGGKFDRVKPKKNFREDGGLGAWEVAVRYSYLDLNDEAIHNDARTAQAVTLGVNWYLNPNVRIMANYIRHKLDGNAVEADADIFAMRVAFDF